MDYRDDDILDQGFCPVCGRVAREVYVDGSGWCSEHGKVWLNWEQTRDMPDEEEEDDRRE
jgi:hypothetical protein